MEGSRYSVGGCKCKIVCEVLWVKSCSRHAARGNLKRENKKRVPARAERGRYEDLYHCKAGTTRDEAPLQALPGLVVKQGKNGWSRNLT